MRHIKDKLLITPLVIIWLSHLIQVFVPETGFDALWYHLPVAKAIVENKGLVYLPNLYQSVNPLFADLYFTFGYALMGDIGAKIVAYLFAIGLMIISYLLSRKYLNKNWSLLLITLVSTFQVVAWQSASFYIDLAKAFFELGSLFFLYNFLFQGSLIVKNQNMDDWKYLIVSGIFFGASMASKVFSIFLLPVYLLIVFIFSKQNKLKNTITFLLSSLLIPLPFYIFTYLKIGHPFYSLVLNITKLQEFGGNSNFFIYILSRTIKLPLSLGEMFLANDYVSFIFLIFLPIFIVSYKQLFSKQKLFLILFSLGQLIIWWYLPPLSTRYALSGFITLTILYFNMAFDFIKREKNYYWPILISIILSILINFSPRLLVNIRSFDYLLGNKTKQAYLEQFYDGSIDDKIKEWHFHTTP